MRTCYYVPEGFTNQLTACLGEAGILNQIVEGAAHPEQNAPPREALSQHVYIFALFADQLFKIIAKLEVEELDWVFVSRVVYALVVDSAVPANTNTPIQENIGAETTQAALKEHALNCMRQMRAAWNAAKSWNDNDYNETSGESFRLLGKIMTLLSSTAENSSSNPSNCFFQKTYASKLPWCIQQLAGKKMPTTGIGMYLKLKSYAEQMNTKSNIHFERVHQIPVEDQISFDDIDARSSVIEENIRRFDEIRAKDQGNLVNIIERLMSTQRQKIEHEKTRINEMNTTSTAGTTPNERLEQLRRTCERRKIQKAEEKLQQQIEVLQRKKGAGADQTPVEFKPLSSAQENFERAVLEKKAVAAQIELLQRKKGAGADQTPVEDEDDVFEDAEGHPLTSEGHPLTSVEDEDDVFEDAEGHPLTSVEDEDNVFEDAEGHPLTSEGHPLTSVEDEDDVFEDAEGHPLTSEGHPLTPHEMASFEHLSSAQENAAAQIEVLQRKKGAGADQTPVEDEDDVFEDAQEHQLTPDEMAWFKPLSSAKENFERAVLEKEAVAAAHKALFEPNQSPTDLSNAFNLVTRFRKDSPTATAMNLMLERAQLSTAWTVSGLKAGISRFWARRKDQVSVASELTALTTAEEQAWCSVLNELGQLVTQITALNLSSASQSAQYLFSPLFNPSLGAKIAHLQGEIRKIQQTRAENKASQADDDILLSQYTKDLSEQATRWKSLQAEPLTQSLFALQASLVFKTPKNHDGTPSSYKPLKMLFLSSSSNSNSPPREHTNYDNVSFPQGTKFDINSLVKIPQPTDGSSSTPLRVSFENANLTSCEFTEVTKGSTTIKKQPLEGVNFQGANLTNTTFTFCSDSRPISTCGIIVDSKTKMSEALWSQVIADNMRTIPRNPQSAYCNPDYLRSLLSAIPKNLERNILTANYLIETLKAIASDKDKDADLRDIKHRARVVAEIFFEKLPALQGLYALKQIMDSKTDTNNPLQMLRLERSRLRRFFGNHGNTRTWQEIMELGREKVARAAAKENMPAENRDIYALENMRAKLENMRSKNRDIYTLAMEAPVGRRFALFGQGHRHMPEQVTNTDENNHMAAAGA